MGSEMCIRDRSTGVARDGRLYVSPITTPQSFSSRTARFCRLELHKRTSGGRQAAGNIGCKYEHKFTTLVVHVRSDWCCAFGSLARHVPARVLSM